MSGAEDQQWAAIAHLGGIIGFLPSLVIWLAFRGRGAKINVEAKEALNFQITALIGYVICAILGALLAIIYIGFLFYLIAIVIFVVSVVFSLFGFLAVNQGGSYRYPFAIRLIK
jgi:uncharacterized Tic20 family protein